MAVGFVPLPAAMFVILGLRLRLFKGHVIFLIDKPLYFCYIVRMAANMQSSKNEKKGRSWNIRTLENF